MPSGPPKRLETFLGLWIPPACREEVLGDLHEKYTGPWQYISLALCVIPFVILSRVRRTTDALILLTEALLIYGSFLAAAWHTERALLTGHWGLWRLAIPTVLNLVVLILDRAWNFKTRWWHVMLVNTALISIGLGFNMMLGECVSVILVAAVEFLSRPGTDMRRSAAGPALWLKQRPGPAVLSEITKSLLAAVAITVVTIALVSVGSKPAIVGGFFVIVLLIGLQLGKSRRE